MLRLSLDGLNLSLILTAYRDSSTVRNTPISGMTLGLTGQIEGFVNIVTGVTRHA